VNKSKSKVYNVAVKMEGDFDTDEGNLYIGNLDSGMSDTFQANLTPRQEGPLSGTVTFSYEDASGQVSEIVKEFSTDVQAAEMPTMTGPDGMDLNDEFSPDVQQNGESGWKLWAYIICIVVVGVIVTVIVVKKRKAKKMRLLEEEDDYDDESGGGI